MSEAVMLRRGSDEPIHVVHHTLVTGTTVAAELRQWPNGPVLQQWTTKDGSALIEPPDVVLICDRTDQWNWTLGEVTVHLTDPSGARTVLDPIRVRLR